MHFFKVGKSKETYFSRVGDEGRDFALDRDVVGVLQAAKKPGALDAAPAPPPERKGRRAFPQRLPPATGR